MAFKLDVSGDDFAALDQLKLSPDYYLCTCTKVYDDEKDRAQRLDFKVCHGPFTNAVISWKLQNPEVCNDETKARSAIARLKAVGKRLGVIYEGPDKRPAQHDWQWAVGKDYVIQVELRTWQKEDGGEGQASQVSYMGCFNLDHPEIPVAVRVRLGLPLLPGQSLDGPAPTPAKGKGKASPNGAAAQTSPVPVQTAAELAAGFG